MSTLRQQIFRSDGLHLVLHVEEGTGPVMFFQHGLCGDAVQPAAVFPRDAGVRLAVLECRGHGRSEPGDPSAFSLATFAEDVASAIRAVSDGPCVVGGISMGAAIAMRIACREPGLVSGLVIARPAWGVEAAPENMRPNLLVGEMLCHAASSDEAMQFAQSQTGRKLATESPDNLKSLLSFFNRAPRDVTAQLLLRLSNDGPA